MYRAIYDENYDKMIGVIDNNHNFLLLSDIPKDAQIKELADEQKKTARQIKKEEQKNNDLARLSKIFTQKTIELTRLAINKPYMDANAVLAQKAVYDSMYANSKAKKASDRTAEDRAIITAHETSEQMLAPVVLLMNGVRAALEARILAGDDVNDLLDVADSLSITAEELTPAKLTELKAAFGL